MKLRQYLHARYNLNSMFVIPFSVFHMCSAFNVSLGSRLCDSIQISIMSNSSIAEMKESGIEVIDKPCHY